ncbi:FecR family protein [Sphingobacterium arenae]|uniref:FecR domain-containing protein n=1 Tax=Sphingobacterium arenae TaxID=1280598 RepID=A0ABR7Y6J6_9SPHI|nr:FecR domain-containing protein [Sphingobacterium arenae]MBD1426934.1 FecR domain-containing protein [Sphingobacterium arenae]
MKRKVFRFLTDRYRQREAGKREKDLFDSWYNSIDGRRHFEPVDKDMRRNRSWQNIQDAIGEEEELVDIKQKRLIDFRPWMGAAALLLASLGFFYWSMQQEMQQQEMVSMPAYRIFTTGVGERKVVSLPDGSEVTLNARTSLRVDENAYGQSTREVELLVGEAFFEVAKDSSRAFIVQAGRLQTTVLGTSFNIQTYAEMEEQVISVYTGRVKVQRGNSNLGTLEKGQRIRFEKQYANSTTEEFDTQQVYSWTSGKLVLQDAGFEELALAIKNTYGIKLEADNDRIARQQYSLPIRKSVPLDEFLEAIQSIHHNKIRKEGERVILY